jgi:hypothetical protein
MLGWGLALFGWCSSIIMEMVKLEVVKSKGPVK